MIWKAKTEEKLLFRSMGKSFRITAFADNDADANRYMETHDRAAVIACMGPLVFMADKYSAGEP